MPDPVIAFVGAGNMAASIIGGLVQRGTDPERIIASDPSADALQRLRATAPVRTTDDNRAAIAEADVLVLAVKPQVLGALLRELADAVNARRPLLVSIAAGVTVAALEQWLGDSEQPIVRCMPNTPALVGLGATALYASAAVSAAQRQLADELLGAVGICLQVQSEGELDAVTALSGSGPAYFFALIEAMQAAGEQLGLQPDTASRLTLQTALGAATMAARSDVDAAELRRRVTSPGGTTECALAEFEQGGLPALVRQAMDAAAARSRELADELADPKKP